MTGIGALALAVRGTVVRRYLGDLLVGLTFMIAGSAAFAALTGHLDFACRSSVMVLVVAVAGWLLRRRHAPSDLQVSEALVVVALTFLVGIAAMVWPLMTDGLGLADAIFEAVSALTTTGLTTVADIEATSRAFQFTRAWMQWCGGLVIAVLALALVIEPGPGARRLLGAESEDLVAGTRQRARRALVVYVVLLLGGALLLLGAGLGPFDAAVHALAAVSTGGFSNRYDSIADVGYLAQLSVIGLTLCGALPLAFYSTSWGGRWRTALRDHDVPALLLAGGVFAVIVTVVLLKVDGIPFAEAFRAGPLLALSAQTTSGFEATKVANLSDAGKAALLLPMFIGGGVGSTAGGIKIARLLLVIGLIRLVWQRARVPAHAVLEEPPAERFATLGLVFLFMGAIVASWLPLLFLDAAPLDSLFEVVSAVGTVGLSSGLTSSTLPAFAKAILCVDMLMGRLEVVAILLLVYPGTWIGRRAPA